MERRERLERLRDRLDMAMVACTPRELPAMARELRLTLAELEGLPAAEGVSARDQVAVARAKRRESAGLPARSTASDKRRR